MLEFVNCCRDEFRKPQYPVWNREIWVSRNFAIVLPGMDARDSDRDNAMYEAVNDQLIGRLIELERLTSVVRLVQTLIVFMEWLIPLLEDVRISRNNLDIIAMLKDNLLNLEAELQQQSWEVREHILTRYHRALRGWRER
jgi:ATP-dependent helicase/DNAse subunit B